MRQGHVQVRRTHKMVLITNNKPRVSEDTEAVWRRVRLIPFNVVIPAEQRDPNLIETLQAERPGILAWCVRGCLEQLRDGMNPPAEVMLATEQYRQQSDELADFIAACCIEGADTLRVSRADLYATYLSWAKRSNDRWIEMRCTTRFAAAMEFSRVRGRWTEKRFVDSAALPWPRQLAASHGHNSR